VVELGALPAGDDKREAVRAMFDRIAPRYDRMNRLLTAGLDQRWRRRALRTIGVGPGDLVLDLACGTGDLIELARARGARAVGIDFAREMLRGAARRDVGALLVRADGARLPFADGSANALTCGFALRNFVSLPDVFAEMARVLAPNGRFAFVEVDRPRSAALRACHSFYFDRVVPWLGALLSDRAAYTYLPKSTAYLPPETELLAEIAKAGFGRLRKTSLLLGAAQIVTGVRT
jgi:demethylmenaquinone methyltransferase/2-methoxy-6-polyprenyl-1,4-benzoquinol methylase